jgi:hypothetical protein
VGRSVNQLVASARRAPNHHLQLCVCVRACASVCVQGGDSAPEIDAREGGGREREREGGGGGVARRPPGTQRDPKRPTCRGGGVNV